MTKRVLCGISNTLYSAIIEEQKRLREIERRKKGTRKRVITMVMASQSLARKLR